MIKVPTNKLYYNIRQYYAAEVLSKELYKEIYSVNAHLNFKNWLKGQGANLIKYDFGNDVSISRITDSFGISPGYDYFEFENDQEATAFVLRWS